MPPQKRLRGHDQTSSPTWKHPGKRREERTIGRSERRACLLPAEHDELMSQHEQFDVFGELAAPASGKQPQYSREREIGEGEEHSPMLPELITVRAKTPNLGFETPQVLTPFRAGRALKAKARPYRDQRSGELAPSAPGRAGARASRSGLPPQRGLDLSLQAPSPPGPRTTRQPRSSAVALRIVD
jgi:hypothetical protein